MQFTKKQHEILTFISNYQREHSISPTLEEIAEHMGVSKITIHEHIAALVKKGAIKKEKHFARSLEILAPEFREKGLPLAGVITAGMPIEAIEQREVFDPGEIVPPNCECYVLRVKGDSMIDEGIRDGDLVLVEKQPTAYNGQTVVAIIGDNEATLKKFYREQGRIRLQPANENMEPFIVDNCEIRGVVRGVIRKY